MGRGILLWIEAPFRYSYLETSGLLNPEVKN